MSEKPPPLSGWDRRWKYVTADILAWMEPDTLYSIQDVTEGVPSVVAAGLSAARVSAMLTQLANSGDVARIEDKHNIYYTLT